MWDLICVVVLISQIYADQIVNSTITVEDNAEAFQNITAKARSNNVNNTLEMQRIIQPSAHQSQQIERTINSSLIVDKSDSNRTEFRPSPQLETYYEFNKFPVPPAFPEAKHFSHLNFGEFPQQHNVQWPDKIVTTEQSWTARVKFPTTPTIETTKERPYEFYNDKSIMSTGKSYSFPSKTSGFGSVIPTSIGNWENPFYEKKKQQIQKNQFDFTAPVERPYMNIHKTNFDFGLAEAPHQHSEVQQGNPWKKIIKFLTAFIPIGLLISALTPTVITVTAMNGTQTRSRAEDSVNQSTKRLVTSLNHFNVIGCEDRILCELLVSASASKNAEQHVKNLLNTFTKDGKAVERADEMKKIFAAVRDQDCRPIICSNIKENT